MLIEFIYAEIRAHAVLLWVESKRQNWKIYGKTNGWAIEQTNKFNNCVYGQTITNRNNNIIIANLLKLCQTHSNSNDSEYLFECVHRKSTNATSTELYANNWGFYFNKRNWHGFDRNSTFQQNNKIYCTLLIEETFATISCLENILVELVGWMIVGCSQFILYRLEIFAMETTSPTDKYPW